MLFDLIHLSTNLILALCQDTFAKKSSMSVAHFTKMTVQLSTCFFFISNQKFLDVRNL